MLAISFIFNHWAKRLLVLFLLLALTTINSAIADSCRLGEERWVRAIDGLRAYAWRGERLSFPALKSLLKN